MQPEPARLAALPLFEELSPEQLELVASWPQERRVSAGQPLVSEGASGYAFFVIEEGTAGVERAGATRRRLGPGDPSARSRSSTAAGAPRAWSRPRT